MHKEEVKRFAAIAAKGFVAAMRQDQRKQKPSKEDFAGAIELLNEIESAQTLLSLLYSGRIKTTIDQEGELDFDVCNEGALENKKV